MSPLLSSIKIIAQPAKKSEYELVQALTQQLPLTEVVSKRWFTYNEATGCWEDNDKDSYRHMALQIMSAGERTVTRAHRVLDHLEDTIRKKLDFHGFIKAEGFSTILINTKNKVLRVTAGNIEVLEHDFTYRFTRSLDVDYDPEAVNRLFLDTLVQVLDDSEDRDLLQLLWANAFIPDARYAVCGVLYGEAGAGKDTIMGPFMSLFGSPDKGLITNFSIAQICDPKSYALPQLQFAAVNVCTELNNTEVQDSSIFKTIVAGGSVPARAIYDKPFNMTTPCKLFGMSNNLPEFKGGTDAERRRMRYIRCNFKPTVIDVSLKERLNVAHPGTLNWILAGLQKLLAMGVQPMPFGGPASREVHDRFFANNDPLLGFVTKYCIFDKDAKTDKDHIRELFALYSEDNDISKEFAKSFFRALYKRFPNIQGKRVQTTYERHNMVLGLRLNQVALDDLKPVQPLA